MELISMMHGMIFSKPILKRKDDRKDYGEERWIALGNLDGAIVVVIYTLRDEAIRIISIRRANRYERKIYTETLEDQQN
jgi:uncharacterized DUF497 family protein